MLQITGIEIANVLDAYSPEIESVQPKSIQFGAFVLAEIFPHLVQFFKTLLISKSFPCTFAN